MDTQTAILQGKIMIKINFFSYKNLVFVNKTLIFSKVFPDIFYVPPLKVPLLKQKSTDLDLALASQ